MSYSRIYDHVHVPTSRNIHTRSVLPSIHKKWELRNVVVKKAKRNYKKDHSFRSMAPTI